MVTSSPLVGCCPSTPAADSRVLVFQRFLKVGDRDAEVGEFVGLYPNLHGVISAAYLRNAPYARDTPQKVDYIERGEVT